MTSRDHRRCCEAVRSDILERQLGFLLNEFTEGAVTTENGIGCSLADRTNGRAYATLLRPSVVVCRRRLSSVTLCIVAKRCVIEQKLLLRAYRKSYIRNRLVPK